MSIIPQGTPANKTTVLFGTNVSIMCTTPERQLAAWLFVKYLSRSDVTARWRLDYFTGYLPVRQSAWE